MMDEDLQRALRGGLYVVEKSLRTLIDVLDHPHMRGITYSIEGTVDPRSNAAARPEVDGMLKEVELLKKFFRLPTQVQSTERCIHSCLSEVWVILNECKPERIQGYGKLNASDSCYLDAHIDALLLMLTRLENVLYDDTELRREPHITQNRKRLDEIDDAPQDEASERF
jgi:hypothetical protein